MTLGGQFAILYLIQKGPSQALLIIRIRFCP